MKLNGDLVPGGNVQTGFQISPDGSSIIYRADQDADEVFEMYQVPLAGGTPLKINRNLPVGGMSIPVSGSARMAARWCSVRTRMSTT